MWKRSVKVKKINNRESQTAKETLVVDLPYRIKLNDTLLLDTTHIPTLENELAIGYLMSHFYIDSPKNVTLTKADDHTFVCETKGPRVSKPSYSPKPSTFHMTTLELFHLTSQFQEQSFLYKDTSITHSAALADPKKIYLLTQDIHSKNAIDKLIGSVALGTCPSAPILLVSGKIDRLLIDKALFLGVEMIVSRLAPTQGAYDMAARYKLSLIGFARGVRMSVYLDEGRLYAA